MKLRASRPQDLADVAQLVAVGIDVGAVLKFLRVQGTDHVPTFSRIAQQSLG